LSSTDKSEDKGNIFGRGLLPLATGRRFTEAGANDGSNFYGETLSGRAIADISSHCTLRHLHFEPGQLTGSTSHIPTMVPVNLCSGTSSPSNFKTCMSSG